MVLFLTCECLKCLILHSVYPFKIGGLSFDPPQAKVPFSIVIGPAKRGNYISISAHVCSSLCYDK